VKRVAGVIGIANDLEVRLPAVSERPDPDIARDAVAALKNELPYSSENMKVIVKDGWTTLEGSAEWNYQRTRAEEAVRRVRGIKGVINLITMKPRVAPSEIKSKIEEAFRRLGLVTEFDSPRARGSHSDRGRFRELRAECRDASKRASTWIHSSYWRFGTFSTINAFQLGRQATHLPAVA